MGVVNPLYCGLVWQFGAHTGGNKGCIPRACMPTIMASGGAGCSVAVSAEVIVEYIAIDDAAGTATVNVTLVPYI